MPPQDADLFEILVSQMGEYGNVNLILSKSLSDIAQDRAFRASLESAPSRPLTGFLVACASDQRRTEFILPAARLKGAFW